MIGLLLGRYGSVKTDMSVGGMINNLSFTEGLIATDFRYAYGVSVADIIGNGCCDVVATDGYVGIYWFENTGDGKFIHHVISKRSGELLERHCIADINGDGKPEIVAIDNINGCIIYFEYDGDPRDSRSWTSHYVTEGGMPGAYDVDVADFNGDGRLDVAASGWRIGNQFAWFENRGSTWRKHLIDRNASEARMVRAADINQNGLPDLVGTASGGGEVVWYANPGDLIDQVWKKYVIDSSPRPMHGQPVDVDQDGDVDVVMSLGSNKNQDTYTPAFHQVVWYENDGHPERTPWKKHVIADYFPMAFEAVAGDLDGDGNIEVVATAWGQHGSIAVFKHRGDPRGKWDKYTIKSDWVNANQVLLADIDGDGRLDILSCAEGSSNDLRWWRNEIGSLTRLDPAT